MVRGEIPLREIHDPRHVAARGANLRVCVRDAAVRRWQGENERAKYFYHRARRDVRPSLPPPSPRFLLVPSVRGCVQSAIVAARFEKTAIPFRRLRERRGGWQGEEGKKT